MENKLAKIVALLTVAGLMAMGPMVYAENEGNASAGAKNSNRGEGKGLFKGIELTAQQKEMLKAQRDSKNKKNSEMRAQLEAKTKELEAKVAMPGTKRADVDILVREVNAINGQMFSERIDGVFSMKEVLTPEQFAKMQSQQNENKGRKNKKQ
jgi:Spy/CpxP family protein refolding chaperone